MYEFTKSFMAKAENTITKYNMLGLNDGVVAGLSGGADSVALLKVLANLKDKYNLRICAVHINHSIRGNEAERDEEFAKEIAKKLGVEFISFKIDVPKYASELHISEELAGREIRYKKFNEVLSLKSFNKIAVAHNKNDSVETVLIKLARGSALNGLKGIMPKTGNIIRPLIATERADIESFLNENNLNFVTDSTNLTCDYTRNSVRNLIIPQFEKLNPSFISTVFSNLESLCDDDEFLETTANSYNSIIIKNNNGDIEINKSKLNNLEKSIKRRVLLNALSKLSGTRLDIEKKHIEIILSNLQNTGAKLALTKGVTVHIGSNSVILSNLSTKCESKEQVFHIGDFEKTMIEFAGNSIILEMTDYNSFIMQKKAKNTVYINCDNANTVKIRNRAEGDRFKPSGMNGTKKLKQFLCELKIPAVYRDLVPLAEIDGIIGAVIPYRVAEDFIINKETKKILKITLGGTNE